MSRSTLMAYAAEAARRRKIAPPSTQVLLGWSLGRLARKHWKVAQVMGDEFLLKGYGTFARRLADRFGKDGDQKPSL